MHRFTIGNDRGSALVIGMLTLALLSLLGSAATTTSRTEIQIAGNDKSYKEAFYTAEVALTAGEMVVEQLVDRSSLDELATPGHYGKEGSEDPQPAWDAMTWDDAHSAKVTADGMPSGLGAHGTEARYTVAERGLDRDSIKLEGPNTGVYYFTVTGHGSGSGKHAAKTVLQTIYARRYN